MQIKKTTWAILISLLAFFLRAYMAYNGPIEYDEGIYLTTAVEYNTAMRQGNWTQILDSTFNYEHPQFYKLVYAVGLFPGKSITYVYRLNGGNDLKDIPYWPKLFSLRMISAFLGAAAVFLLSLIHPLAGLFLAIDTLGIKYTSVITLEALPAFTSLGAFMAALKSQEAFQNNPARWRKWGGWLALSSLAMGMSAASKYMYGIVGIAIVFAIILELWKRKIPAFLGLAGWGILSIILFIILDPVLWHSTLSRLVNSIQFNINYSGGAHVLEVGYPFWQPIKWLLLSQPQQPEVPPAFFSYNGNYFVLADTLIFILAVAGLPAFYRKNKPMFIWLVVGLIFLLVWGTKWPQYVMMILAPYCLAAVYGYKFIRSCLLKFRSRSNPKLPAD